MEESPEALRPRGLQTLGAWTQAMLWVSCGSTALCALVAGLAWRRFAGWQEARRTPLQDAWTTLDTYHLTAALFFYAMLATIVLFIVWLWRADWQASALAPHRPARLRRWWTIGGWFIPIAGLFIPKRIVDDVWRRAVAGSASSDHRQLRVPQLFHWWWALYLIGFSLPSLSAHLDPEVRPGDLGPFLTAMTLVHATLVVAAVLAAGVVRETGRRLLQRAEAEGVPLD